MIEKIIIPLLTGSFVCIFLMIFKNMLLRTFKAITVYRIALAALTLFFIPINIISTNQSKTQTIDYTPITVQNDIKIDNKDAPTDKASDVSNNTTQEAYLKQPYIPQASEDIKKPNPITPAEIITGIWILGFVLLVLRYFVPYFIFKAKIRKSEVVGDAGGIKIRKSNYVLSPIIFGVFKSVLIIPDIDMTEKDYELAIQHELMHHKNHDALKKLFVVLVNCIFWFNPVTYFMVNFVGEICEYACDEAVVEKMSVSERKEYSMMILNIVCQSSPTLSSNMAKNKKQLLRRFKRIMKKGKFSIVKSMLCTILILLVAGVSVLGANELTNVITSKLKKDYVYIETFGNGEHKSFVPIDKNGTYYLPLRDFLNASDVDNDKIKYENGQVTIDIWSNEMRMINAGELSDGGEKNAEKQETIIPAEYRWSTSCTVNNKTVSIDGKEIELKNAPYIENNVMYVPYEYFEKLKDYESTSAEGYRFTHKFISVLLYKYDSLNNEFSCDSVYPEGIPGGSDYSYIAYNESARISKTGYRTECEITFDYIGANSSDENGHIEVVLEEVVRIYSDGSDIEGIFTVKKNGETIFDKERGYITALPIPAGDGITTFNETILNINEFKCRMFFKGVSNQTEGYDELGRRNVELSKSAETKKIQLVPLEVKLNGIEVSHGNSNQLFFYNEEYDYGDINLQFACFDETGYPHNYRIYSEDESVAKRIDENTFWGKFYFNNDQYVRIDSFEGFLVFDSNGNFEFKSDDGRYIVRGITKEFIPVWAQTESQRAERNASFVMIK